MRSHTRLAVVVALALVVATVLVDAAHLPWAVPLLPLLAWLLNRTRWTDLARLRVVQAAAVGQTVAVIAILLGAPLVVAIPGLVLLALATVITGYGVVRFPARR